MLTQKIYALNPPIHNSSQALFLDRFPISNAFLLYCYTLFLLAHIILFLLKTNGEAWFYDTEAILHIYLKEKERDKMNLAAKKKKEQQ